MSTLTSTSTAPILIIGAGISGLTLAQHLRDTGVPFQMFERDQSITTRSGGWGLTLHWGLAALRELVPTRLLDRLPETGVNQEAVRRGDNGRYQFFNLQTGEAKYSVPAAERIRVSRLRLKELLATDLDIQFSKCLASIEHTDESVTAHFEDGTSSTGKLLAACDGAYSRVRRTLYPSNYAPSGLPIRFLGVMGNFTKEQVESAVAIDPYIFQGTHPETDTYLFFSFLGTSRNFGDSPDTYTCQVIVSWPFRPGVCGESEPIEVPTDHSDRVALMKRLTDNWAEPFRSLVHNVPDDSEAVDIKLEDWIPEPGAHGKGPIALVGDSAHSMTMFRGEGANHALVDVSDFVKHLGPHFPRSVRANGEAKGSGEQAKTGSIRDAIDAFEDTVNARAIPGVLASRQACLDAHDFPRINDSSPLVARRVVMTKNE